jgi:hypothetical protein
MKTPISSITLFAIAAILGAAGQFFYKTGAARVSKSLWSLFNLWLIGGVICYVGAMVLLVAAFKRGEPETRTAQSWRLQKIVELV